MNMRLLGDQMKKKIIIISAVLLAAAAIFTAMNFQSADEYYLDHADDITPESETVFLTISCGSVFDNYEKLDSDLKNGEYIPSDGVILRRTEYVLREGDTVFDILYRAARHEKIQFEYQGANGNSFGTAYVQGINYLYEFSCGSTSGWTYSVNGVFPNYGCSKYELCDKDEIEWVYTCDLGQNTVGGAQ